MKKSVNVWPSSKPQHQAVISITCHLSEYVYALLLYAEVVNFYNPFWMMREVQTSSQKTVEEISFFSHHRLSAVSARSEWIRCGCRRAHKSYKHWGNVFQTCLPGVICQEWVTPFYTERAPFHLSGVLQPIGLNVQCCIAASGHGRDVTETKPRQSSLSSVFCAVI